MQSVYTFQVPEQFKANRPNWVRKTAQWIVEKWGWHMEGSFPEEENRLVVAAAPHTSNWDFVIGMLIIMAIDLRINWIGKHSIFVPGVRRLWHWLGGMPVNRDHPEGLIDHLVSLYQKQQGTIIAMSPEGTRTKVERWKTGFLRIARMADAKVIGAGLDFGKKRILISSPYVPTQNDEEDIALLQTFFAQCEGKKPQNA